VSRRVDEERERRKLPVRVEARTDVAADVSVETRAGEVQLIPARAKRYRLVHFWATTCPPCRKELPTLVDMARRNRDRLDVWAISTDSEWVSVDRFLNGSVPSIIVRDRDGSASSAYGVTTLPDSYLIDPEGNVRARFSGPQNWTSREMDTILDRFILQT
jgi:thiol-disulfide isomerase/thioredoxin